MFATSKTGLKAPVRVAVTGANGNIGYATLFRIARGDLLGPDQPVILHLIDLPSFQNGLKAISMELHDCAFPLLRGVVGTDSLVTGFKDIDYALLIGAKPRTKGMERADLLKENGKIFIETGKALNENAHRNVKVIVVGNPANTNCLIAQSHAPDLPRENFTAMTRLDHNRALYQIAKKYNAQLNEVKNFCIWGNHSPTMFPDLTHTLVKGEAIYSKVERQWLDNDFIPKVQQRGTAIINARGTSSAASAGNAAIDHIHDWVLGTHGEWTSMGVYSNGEYGIAKGLIYSFPVTTNKGEWKIVKDLEIRPEALERMKKTEKELLEERETIAHLIK